MRIVGKCGFLLAVMGFFMPVACDKNAFQLIDYVDKTSAALIIILFILAIIGCIIGMLLLMKNDVPIAVDWVIILASIGIGIGLLRKNELELQYGAHVIITGFSVALIFVLIASFMSDSDNSYNRGRYFSSEDSSENGLNKKCRLCGETFSGSYTGCPLCGSSLYEELNSPANVSSIAPINANYGDTWTCKKCGEKNPIVSSSCKGCGEYK
jgi:ribosomal protein L40E